MDVTEQLPGSLRWIDAGQVGAPTYADAYDQHPYLRARGIWGTANIKSPTDIVAIGPLGRRNDTLICWKAAGRVATGQSGGPETACFEGSIPEFVVALGSYDEWIHEAARDGKDLVRDNFIRLRNDYLAAVSFLRHVCGYKDDPTAAEINRVAEDIAKRYSP